MTGGTSLALLARYRQTFACAWRERHRNSPLLLTVDEAEFSPPALSLEQRPVSPTLRVTAALLMSMVMATIAWATVGRVDIDANATGEIIASGRTKTIASVDTAVVRAIHVTEGQAVKAGQVLLELDATPFQDDFKKANSELENAQLQMARSRALIAAITSGHSPRLGSVPGVPLQQLRDAQRHLESQYVDFSAKLAQLDSDIAHYSGALPVAMEREKIYQQLLETHDVSRDSWLEKEQARIDIQGQLATAQDARAALMAQTEREAYDAYTEAAKTAAGSQQDASSAASHAAWLTLRAPVDGTAQQIAVHTIGGVVQAAQPLMQIVPQDTHLQVEAFLANRDVGFVRSGQPAQVKVATFDYTKYGAIPGHVISVSRDAIAATDTEQDDDTQVDNPDSKRDKAPRYLVRVSLDKTALNVDGRTTQLIPGMSVDIEIKTGRRRLVEYVLSPLLRHETESLHER